MACGLRLAVDTGERTHQLPGVEGDPQCVALESRAPGSPRVPDAAPDRFARVPACVDQRQDKFKAASKYHGTD